MKQNEHLLFDKLIIPHYGLIVTLVSGHYKHYLRSTTDRFDDMLQEVLISLFKACQNFDPEADNLPLIRHIVKLTVWKKMRSVNDRMGISFKGIQEKAEDTFCESDDFDDLLKFIDFHDDNDEITAYNTIRKDNMKHYTDDVYKAVNKLTELQRSTIFGILEGYSFEELAEQLKLEGETNATVNNLMLQYYFGITNLKESLKKVK